MILPSDALIALIESHPNGMTSAQVATATGRKLGNVTGRLSKLYNYGLIRKERFPRRVIGNMALWLPKQKATE